MGNRGIARRYIKKARVKKNMTRNYQEITTQNGSWTHLAHGLRNEVIVSSERAQKGTSSCPRAPFIMLSPGCKTVLWAKLAHIVTKESQGFNTCPADPREFPAPLFPGYNGFFWLTRRQFVEHRLDDVEGVASVSEQGHDAQAAHLLLVVETVAAVLLANRVQQALLFPEMQGRDTYTHLFGRLSYSESLRMGGALQRGGPSG